MLRSIVILAKVTPMLVYRIAIADLGRPHGILLAENCPYVASSSFEKQTPPTCVAIITVLRLVEVCKYWRQNLVQSTHRYWGRHDVAVPKKPDQMHHIDPKSHESKGQARHY